MVRRVANRIRSRECLRAETLISRELGHEMKRAARFYIASMWLVRSDWCRFQIAAAYSNLGRAYVSDATLRKCLEHIINFL